MLLKKGVKNRTLSPLISNITLEILLSYCHTLVIVETGRTEFMLGGHILYSHDLSDREGVDIAKINLTPIRQLPSLAGHGGL